MTLYVSDYGLGIFWDFNLEGVLLEWVDLEREEDALMGITFDSEGRLYVVDSVAEEVLRIDL